MTGYNRRFREAFDAYTVLRPYAMAVLNGPTDGILCNNHANPTAFLALGKQAMVAGDPCAPGMRTLLSHVPYGCVLAVPDASWERRVSDLWGRRAERIACTAYTRVNDPVPPPVPPPDFPPGFSLTLCGPGQARSLARLQPGLAEQFGSYSGLFGHGICIGVACDNKVVAAATTVLIADGCAELTVKTHRRYRNRGYARACVQAVLARSLSMGLAPYWHAVDDISRRLAESAGMGGRIDHLYFARHPGRA